MTGDPRSIVIRTAAAVNHSRISRPGCLNRRNESWILCYQTNNNW